MITARIRLLRALLCIVLLLIFASLAYLLYSKQQEKFNYGSFQISESATNAIFPNIDRTIEKLSGAEELSLPNLPGDLISAINAVIAKPEFKFADHLSPDGLLSWDGSDFLMAFETNAASASDLAELLQTHFNVQATSTGDQLTIAERIFIVNQYNHYLVIGTKNITPVSADHNEHYGNADVVLFSPEFPAGCRYILNPDGKQQIWEEKIAGPQGSPIIHQPFLKFVPATFDKLWFYGSNEFSADRLGFFSASDSLAFTWVENGLIYLEKDSFRILIAPQNESRELKLLLEEQTFELRGDTNFIPYFNIGSHQVMPFESTINWQQSFQDMTNNFAFFASQNNFNILANSIPAMRWYLSELQLGNLFLKNPHLKSSYMTFVPQRAHQFEISHLEGLQYNFKTSVWQSNQSCIQVACQVGQSQNQQTNIELLADFETTLIPTKIQPLKKSDSVYILLNNENTIALYDLSGNLQWQRVLNENLNETPQLIDLENDGIQEIVLFQPNQFDIIRQDGQSVSGFPKKLSAKSNGGTALNYDNAYNYRFLIHSGNQVKSYDESGNLVTGWMFQNMSGELRGPISYYVSQGKDLISFKDINNTQYVINRRGESRLSKMVKVSLPCESDFVVGLYDESSLRKLGYHNGYIYNHYLLDSHTDSVKIDKTVHAIQARWIFNNNKPLLLIEETERVVVLDEFGYETESVLKPGVNQELAGIEIQDELSYVFVDNSQNALYLLDGLGKMIFPVPVNGSKVYCLSENLLYTFVGTKLKVYKTN